MYTPQKQVWKDKSYQTPQKNIAIMQSVLNTFKQQCQDNFTYFNRSSKQTYYDEVINKLNQKISDEKLKILQLEIILKDIYCRIHKSNYHYSGKPLSSSRIFHLEKYQSKSQIRNSREKFKTQTKIKPEAKYFDTQFTPEKSKYKKFQHKQQLSYTQPRSYTQKIQEEYSREPKIQQFEENKNQFDQQIKNLEQQSNIQSKVRGKQEESKDQLQILNKINEVINERKSFKAQIQEKQQNEDNQPQDQNEKIEQNEQIQNENNDIEEERKSNDIHQEEEQQKSEQNEVKVDQENIVKQYQPNENRLQIVYQTIQQLYEASGVNNRGIEQQFRYFIQQREDKKELFSNYDIRQLGVKKQLENTCDSIQKVRGDGNCFYTAFGFQFLELLLLKFSDQEYQDFINWINQINLRFKIHCKDFTIDDPELESQLREHFLFLLQELRFTENAQRQIDLFEKFREFEIEPNGNGFFYPLSTIFFRNLSDFLLEFCEQKDAVYDRINLITWEEECDNNELIISNLAEQLKLRIKLLFFEDGSCTLREYGDEQNSQIILLIRPGHYNIGKKQH